MPYFSTENGYNMFDMLSMLQKSIRRGKFTEAGFAAEQLKGKFRSAMWNRLLVISSEDCYGIITKEVCKLRDDDFREKDDKNVARAVALMCRSRKSRDACYYACNFVLASRLPRTVVPGEKYIRKVYDNISFGNKKRHVYDKFGFAQMSLFECNESEEPDEIVSDFAALICALEHVDMDVSGYYIDKYRKTERKALWDLFRLIADDSRTGREIEYLEHSDDILNEKKKDKDEIFLSKAAILLCYCNDPGMNDRELTGCDIISSGSFVDWNDFEIMPIDECCVKEIPEWVYDCHTIKGKKAGKTDWDMTRTEQEALTPLEECYFDHASWEYTYDDDYRNGRISREQMKPIWEFGKLHPANPVEHLMYTGYEVTENEKN